MPEFVKPATVPVQAIVREVDAAFSDDKKGEKEFRASLIEVQGRVRGSRGYGYLNYLAEDGNSPGQARNDARIQERANAPVIIGYEDDVPVIKRLDYSRMDPQGAQGYRSPLFAHHSPDHVYGSGDPLYVDTRQIKELMVIPAGLLKVNITPGRYGNGLGYAYFAGRQNYDLAAYQPAVAGTKRKVGLYLDSAGALQVVSGGLVARTAIIPELAWPAGVFRLASVILFENKSFVDWEYIKQEKALYTNPVTKATGLYTPAGALAWSVDSAGNLDNDLGGIITAPAAEVVVKVRNASGATVAAGDLGYIDEAGQYQRTTTAGLIASWAVVVVGGANDADIYVANRGRFTVTYTGTAPSAGHFLTTSTVAGAAQRSTVMTPAIFAVCLAAGSGGLVEALLLGGTIFVAYSSDFYVVRTNSTSSSDFIALINAGGSGGLTSTNVPYDTISAGAENVIVPANQGGSELGRMRLYNVTRGTYRLITAVNTTTDVITTIASTDSWADNDSITIQSQTCVHTSPGGSFYIDVDLSQQSEIPILARAIQVQASKIDTNTAGRLVQTHPFETFNAQKQKSVLNQVAAAVLNTGGIVIPLVDRKFCWRFSAGTAGSSTQIIDVMGYWLAAP